MSQAHPSKSGNFPSQDRASIISFHNENRSVLIRLFPCLCLATKLFAVSSRHIASHAANLRSKLYSIVWSAQDDFTARSSPAEDPSRGRIIYQLVVVECMKPWYVSKVLRPIRSSVSLTKELRVVRFERDGQVDVYPVAKEEDPIRLPFGLNERCKMAYSRDAERM